MLGDALREIGNPNTWVIASAGPLEYAQQGLFARGFLRRGAAAHHRRFPALCEPGHHRAGGQRRARRAPRSRHGCSHPPTGSAGIAPFFANPAYRPGVAGLTVAEQHWLSRVRGGPEESTTGFYLTGKTGRLRAGEHLAAWMTDPGPKGLAVVTGSPGTGKSALLALPVLLTQPALARGPAACRRAGFPDPADGGSAPRRYADRRGARPRPEHRPGRGRDRAGARPRCPHRGRAAGGPERHPGTRRPGRGRRRRRRGGLARHAARQPAASRWPASPACEWPWQPAGTCCPGSSARQT